MHQKNKKYLWSPDEFMFQQFALHLDVMRYPEREIYFDLSSGVNEFPMPKVWKELMCMEIQDDLAYQWYTPEEGFPALQKAAKLWENFAATEGDLYSIKLRSNVCLTLGASQAVAIVFDYLSHNFPSCNILQIGMNYPIFERLSKPYHLKISELLKKEDKDSTFLLPEVDEVICRIRQEKPKMIIITVPNNPTGESYSEDDLIRVFNAAGALDSFVMVDKAGQMPITHKSFVNVGKAILKSDYQDHIIQICSFSKTDSVPGLRLGYFMAADKIVAHSIKYQLYTVLNPQTVPVLPIFYSFLIRSLYLKEKNKWDHYCTYDEVLNVFGRLFEITTAVAPKYFMDKFLVRLNPMNFRADYDRYCQELLHNENCMDKNRVYILQELQEYISRYTVLENGFNFLIELSVFEFADEEVLCQEFFRETKVALLTESCFCLNRPKRGNFWIRISLAAPEEKFRAAVDRFKCYIEKRYFTNGKLQ